MKNNLIKILALSLLSSALLAQNNVNQAEYYYLKKYIEQLDFEPIAQSARFGFFQTVDSLTGRFGGDSRFRNSLAAAGTGLERDLAAQRVYYNMQKSMVITQLLVRIGTPAALKLLADLRLQGVI